MWASRQDTSTTPTTEQTSTSASSVTSFQHGVRAHEAEIIIPGSFVVLQGNAGDGLSNTIDIPPNFTDDERILRDIPTAQSGTQQTLQQPEGQQPPSSASTSATLQQQQQQEDSPQLQQSSTLAFSGEFHHINREDGLQDTSEDLSLRTSTTAPSSTAPQGNSTTAQIRRGNATNNNDENDDDAFIVVSDDPPGGEQQQRQLQNQQSTERQSTTPPAQQDQQQDQQDQQQQQVQQPQVLITTRGSQAITEWESSSREREITQYKDWKIQSSSSINRRSGSTSRSPFSSVAATNTDENHEKDLWWQSQGRIALFADIPNKSTTTGDVTCNIIGTLSPGSTVVATDILYLDSNKLERIQVQPITTTGSGSASHRVYPRGRFGWVQLVKLDIGDRQGTSSNVAYAVMSYDGYPFLAPGLPSLYIDPEVWLWRVSCPAGAFVREGLDLSTKHTDTLPYGSLVRVARKTVNSMGLSRLRIQSLVEQDGSSCRMVDGWCSEFLNPLSGQRGVVVQPVPFPVPAIYKVTLALGAVIRSDVELSSQQIGVAPQGALLTIVGRAFSEHPMDHCIERLKLAGDGGWISLRLNRPPPNDDVVVELVGIDGSFDPQSPGTFHWNQHVNQLRESIRNNNDGNGNNQNNNDEQPGEISSIDDEDDDNEPDKVTTATSSMSSESKRKARSTKPQRGQNPSDDRCLICLTEERNATMVHGETGHVACCLVCARILKARGDNCPVCRLPIDLVIQQFWA